MDFFSKFPSMSRGELRDFKKSIDGNFSEFTGEYGEAIESFFEEYC